MIMISELYFRSIKLKSTISISAEQEFLKWWLSCKGLYNRALADIAGVKGRSPAVSFSALLPPGSSLRKEHLYFNCLYLRVLGMVLRMESVLRTAS